jgi:hypothetical protein
MEMEINLSTFIYFINKHEDKYFGPMCILNPLDGDKFFAILGLFIIGQLHMLIGFKSSIRDAITTHKAIILGMVK